MEITSYLSQIYLIVHTTELDKGEWDFDKGEWDFDKGEWRAKREKYNISHASSWPA